MPLTHRKGYSVGKEKFAIKENDKRVTGHRKKAARSNPRKNIVKFNLLKPTGHVMHQQSNIQQFYILPTLYLCVLYLSENKQRLVPLTA